MTQKTERDDFDAAFNAAVEENKAQNEEEVTPAGVEETPDNEQETPENGQETPENETDEEEGELDIDAIIKERDTYRQKFQSNNGRISAYQRQLEELQQSNAQLASQVAKVPDSSSKGEAREQLAEEIANSSWEELVEDMPDVAGAIDKRLDEKLESRFQTIDQKIQPISQSLQEQARERELAALQSRHPDFHDIASSDEFREWLGEQPLAVQQLQDSNSAAEAAYLLDTYKLQNQTEPTGSIQNRNRDRLKKSIAAPSKRMSRKAAPMDDFDAAFNDAVSRDRR